jgi:uncharacterized protein YihD (DUF1040 family)
MEENEYKKIIENIGKRKDFIINEGILYKEKGGKRLQVIRKEELEGVLFMIHDHPTAAHFGIEATYNRIKDRYYWKNMRKDIEGYVKSCNKCQRRGRPSGRNELNPIEVKEPFYMIGIDFVGPLPVTKRENRYIIVAIDYFTKWPEARAVKEATAKETAMFILEDIICRHGCPKRILSDRGTTFNNKMIKELVDKFRIKHSFSTPYHPKTNGLVERFNKTLKESLAKLKKDNNWDEMIAPTLFAYRTKTQESTKVEPFYITYGRKAVLPIDKEEKKITVIERLQEIVEQMPKIRWKANEEIKKSQQKQKKFHDEKGKRKEKFEIGDKVLYYKAAMDQRWSDKLEERWKGPYFIHEIMLKGSYKIKEIDGRILKVPVNGELLKKYYDREEFLEDLRPEFDSLV